MKQQEHFPQGESHSQLQSAYRLIKEHRLQEAEDIIDSAMSNSFDHPAILSAMKFLRFWKERWKTWQLKTDLFQRADFLLSQWRSFIDFKARIDGPEEECLSAFRFHVFSLVLEDMQSIFADTQEKNAEIMVRMGICKKSLGHFDEASSILLDAYKEFPEDAQIQAQLGDAYALMGDESKAKVFLREAFFTDAQKVWLEHIESSSIHLIMEKLEEKNFPEEELREWIPVYGLLLGVLTVKREIKSLEYGKLLQDIYNLERELEERPNEKKTRIPRLINKYFWLVDHYLGSKEDQHKIQQILLKIRSLDEEIFLLYTR